jgi:VWFA-related protein
MKTLAALTLVFALTAAAQTPYIETFEVRLHNLDVVVTDAKGKPVRGLTKDDFIVTESGVPKVVTNFSVYDVAAGTAASQATAAPAPGSTAPVAEAATPPPPRRVVFFIDDLTVQKMARERVFDNAKQFLASMRDGDLAAVVRPTAAAKVVQELTADRAALERALRTAVDANADAVESSALHRLQWTLKTVVTDSERKIARREYAFAERRRVEHRLGQLRALTNSLAGLEGRKAIVVVSMGLTARPGSEAWDFESEMGVPLERVQAPVIDARGNVNFEAIGDSGDVDQGRMRSRIVGDYSEEISEIGRVAAANGVTIYAIEPDVPNKISPRGDASLPGLPSTVRLPNKYDLPVGFQADLLQNSAATMTTLAEKTGGKWFRGLGSIDDTFRTVSEDLGFYYSLAYSASGERERPRRVEVKVRNRPELRVRTRSEVIEKTTAREMQDLVVASLIYPRPVNELGIAVTTATPVPERGYLRVPIDVVIPLDKLTFLPEGEKYVGAFDIHFAAAGQERDFVSGGKQQQRIELTPEQYEVREGIKYRYKTGIMISPGAARIAIGVLDATTKLTGFQTVEVAAPVTAADGS